MSGEELILCSSCKSKLIKTENDFLQSEYQRKFSAAGFIDQFHSPFVFEEDNPIRNILHELKYNNNFNAGIFLGEEIAKRFSGIANFHQYDFIIPIPLHKLKKAERGYNQSEFIAKGISKITKIKINTKTIKRRKYTQTQTKLSANERKENIQGAFDVNKRVNIEGKKIILIDDVTTTGSTVSEAAKLLKDYGVKKILLLTAAIPKIS